ncbi:MAG TPA: Rossmann-like and DUF2520 domain-containing protein [Terriglobales bacterium]|nr:Rossmann-like and DUF2520 domain-containing protein [Terriglobales bacterium]
MAKPTITIVGTGALGTALLVNLARKGYPIKEIVSRKGRLPLIGNRALPRAKSLSPKLISPAGARLSAKVIWICVRDSGIRECAEGFADRIDWRGHIVLHSSGALTSDELSALRVRGAAVASVHPMMTFVSGAQPRLEGIWFAIEGDIEARRVAERIVADFGGHSFVIPKSKKPLYHTFGAFLSPLIIAHLALTERLGAAAGVPGSRVQSVMRPILEQTLANYTKLGPAGALSGPLARGDVETIRRNLKALSKLADAKQIYIDLVRSAMRTLPVKNRRGLQEMLRGAVTRR